jgi:type II secretory pathway pseudopilin PulG
MRIKQAIPKRGFTLLEVMFAVIAFCTASFAILALFSQSLEEARRLQRPMVDAGLVASVLSQTNSLSEGTYSGDLSDILTDDNYKGYAYEYDVEEVRTNKLFRIDVTLQNDRKLVVSQESFLFFRPASPAGRIEGATQ